MNIPFFTDYLMLSNPLSIGIIAVFVLALIGIYVLQRKGTSFGNLVIIGTIVGAVLGIAIQVIAGFPDDPSKVLFLSYLSPSSMLFYTWRQGLILRSW